MGLFGSNVEQCENAVNAWKERVERQKKVIDDIKADHQWRADSIDRRPSSPSKSKDKAAENARYKTRMDGAKREMDYRKSCLKDAQDDLKRAKEKAKAEKEKEKANAAIEKERERKAKEAEKEKAALERERARKEKEAEKAKAAREKASKPSPTRTSAVKSSSSSSAYHSYSSYSASKAYEPEPEETEEEPTPEMIAQREEEERLKREEEARRELERQEQERKRLEKEKMKERILRDKEIQRMVELRKKQKEKEAEEERKRQERKKRRIIIWSAIGVLTLIFASVLLIIRAVDNKNHSRLTELISEGNYNDAVTLVIEKKMGADNNLDQMCREIAESGDTALLFSLVREYPRKESENIHECNTCKSAIAALVNLGNYESAYELICIDPFDYNKCDWMITRAIDSGRISEAEWIADAVKNSYPEHARQSIKPLFMYYLENKKYDTALKFTKGLPEQSRWIEDAVEKIIDQKNKPKARSVLKANKTAFEEDGRVYIYDSLLGRTR